MTAELIAPWSKGIGWTDQAFSAEHAATLGWNLLHEDLSLPAAVLYADAIENNARWMQQFIEAYGLKLAPHGKTTMAPKLFALQLRTGAWGITLATAPQAAAAYAHGVRRILLANQLVGKTNLEIVSGLLHDPQFEFYCLVDSPRSVELLATHFGEQAQQVRVLLELGIAGGRSGVRDESQLAATLAAISRAKSSVLLAGVEIYEGVLKDADRVRAFVSHAVATTRRLLAAQQFASCPVLLSGAGSAWYDVVAEGFATAGFGSSVDLVLRPGCYLTHDAGPYKAAQECILERNPIARAMQSGLVAALEVWAYVQSRPEPHLAIVALGKRDAAFDAGLPTPQHWFRPGISGSPRPAPAHWSVTKMMDQHAYLELCAEDDAQPGDMIGFGISHPCLTFDKWRNLAVLDREYRVVDWVQTCF